MSFVKKCLASSALIFILITACSHRNSGESSSPVVANIFAYILPAAATHEIDKAEIDSTTGLFTGSSTTAYSSGTQTFQQLTFASVNGTRYAYATDGVNAAVYQCTLNSDASFNTCTSQFLPQGWTPYAVALTAANGVQHAYVSDAINTGAITSCTLNSNGTINSCNPATNSTFAAPYGITFATIGSTQYAYISDAGTGGAGNFGMVHKCPVNSDGSFGTCTNAITSAPNWIPIATAFTSVEGTTYAYVSDNGTTMGNGAVYLCPVDTTDGSFTRCDSAPSTSPPTWNPYSIAFATANGKQYAYVADVQGSVPGKMYRCILANSDAGALSDCQLTLTSPPNIYGPIGIAF